MIFKHVAIGDLVELSRGYNPPKSEFINEPREGYIRFIQIRDAKNDKNIVYVPDSKKLRKVENDDILLVAYRHVGNAFRGMSGAINVALCRLRNKDEAKLLSDYLFHMIPTDHIKGELLRHSERSLIPSMSVKHLAEIKIPLPPLPEQKRIVALLDTVFADLEQTRAKTEQNLKNARELFDSYLQQVFSQKGEGWEEKKWGEICKFIRGPFGGSLKKSMFKSEGYAVYEQKHAIHDHIEQLRYFVDEEKFEEMKRFELKPGELIMSCSGVTLGRASVIPDGAPKGIINQALLKLTANDDLDIHFLKYWIRSKIFQDIIFEHAGGAAIPNVPAAKILKEIKLQIPTIEKQKIIVSEVDSMVSKRDSLLRIYSEKLNAIDELKKSILQKAFSGKLTTTAK